MVCAMPGKYEEAINAIVRYQRRSSKTRQCNRCAIHQPSIIGLAKCIKRGCGQNIPNRDLRTRAQPLVNFRMSICKGKSPSAAVIGSWEIAPMKRPVTRGVIQEKTIVDRVRMLIKSHKER